MDPLSLAGTVIAVGQSIGPIVNGIRALSKFGEVEDSILAALGQSEVFGLKLLMYFEFLQSIDEATMPKVQMAYLKRTLAQMKIAAASHEAEVRNWLRALGISESSMQDELASEAAPSGRGSTTIESVTSGNASTMVTKPRKSRRCKVFSRLSILAHTGLRSLGMRRETVGSEETEKDELPSDKFADSPKPYASLITKMHFVVLGEHNLNQLLSQLKTWDKELRSGMEMIAGPLKDPHLTLELKTDASFAPIRFIMNARKRVASGGNVTIITPDVWKKYYSENSKHSYIDKHAYGTSKQSQVSFGHFMPKCDDPSDEVGRNLESYRNCVVVNRGLMDENQEKASKDLAALFSSDQPDVEVSDKLREDGDMLRCVAVGNEGGDCIMLFKLPPGSSPNPMSLRCALLDSRNNCSSDSYPLHPLPDRVKLAARLTSALFVLHSSGFVHKRINPEKILLVESASGGSSHSFPKRLGYPYLIAFNLSRGNFDWTAFLPHLAESKVRGIYFHYRDQDVVRQHRYSMRDDIYSLGVCLFEIALWRSLFIWSDDGGDYVYDDSFVKLSESAENLKDLVGNPNKLARARTEELIRVAEERIPSAVGPGFAKAVIACLKAHAIDSPFANHPRLKSIRSAPVSKENLSEKVASRSEEEIIQWMECLVYLELVLHQLQAVDRSLQDVAI